VNRPSTCANSAVLSPALVRVSRSAASLTHTTSAFALSGAAAAAGVAARTPSVPCCAHTVSPLAAWVATAVSMSAERNSPVS
jgi:hypothetical protein